MPNGSYQFYGNEKSYIEFPNNVGLHSQHSFTILCWVYFSTSTKGPLFAYNHCFHCLAIYIKDQTLVASFPDQQSKMTTELAFNRWHYIGASFDYATGNASLWVNGTKREQRSFKPWMIFAPGKNVRMGSKSQDSKSQLQNFNFEGRITVMQVYNFALTQVDIEAVKYVALGRGKNMNYKNTVPFFLVKIVLVNQMLWW